MSTSKWLERKPTPELTRAEWEGGEGGRDGHGCDGRDRKEDGTDESNEEWDWKFRVEFGDGAVELSSSRSLEEIDGANNVGTCLE